MLGRFLLTKPAVALIGGAPVSIVGSVTPAQTMGAINLDGILLLDGMMRLVPGVLTLLLLTALLAPVVPA